MRRRRLRSELTTTLYPYTTLCRLTGTGRFRVLDRPVGEVLATSPASSLDDDAPLYDRPMGPPADLAERQAAPVDLAAPSDAGADLLDLLADTSWVWSQYDHHLFLKDRKSVV